MSEDYEKHRKEKDSFFKLFLNRFISLELKVFIPDRETGRRYYGYIVREDGMCSYFQLNYFFYSGLRFMINGRNCMGTMGYLSDASDQYLPEDITPRFLDKLLWEDIRVRHETYKEYRNEQD